ncbi:ribonuclease III [Ceratobasidium sp. AG-I]|nr:ribonuclease III [Ceratobasidium sp. AG-I]
MATSPNAALSPTLEAIFQMCPPLPDISSPSLLNQVFTHRSFAARPNNIFQDNPNDPTPDNESLEHLGDSVLNLITTLHIQTLYPLLHVGPASKIRALIVANNHLAYFAQHYKLHYKLRGNTSQQLTLQASLPIHADLFEAYVGALFKEQGLEPVRLWLSSVLTPSIHLAHEVVYHAYDGPLPSALASSVFPTVPLDSPLMSPPLPAADDAGFTSLLNQHFAKQHKYLDWEFQNPGGSAATPTWTVAATVRGERVLATATASTKKKAKNMAARYALISLNMIQDDGAGHLNVAEDV